METDIINELHINDNDHEEIHPHYLPSSEWRVVLRNASSQAVVLLHPTKKSLMIAPSHRDIHCCPTCKRPFSNSRNEPIQDHPMDTEFIDSNYFRMLQGPGLGHSISSSASSSHGIPSSTTSPRNGASASLDNDAFNQGYYDRFFVEERKLGRGQRGSVFLVQHVLNHVPLGSFAVKAIPIGESRAWLLRMLKEVHTLERLKHPNIIEYKHAWLENRQLSPFAPQVPCLFILMELANGGSLEDYIQIQWNPSASNSFGVAPELLQAEKERRRRAKSQGQGTAARNGISTVSSAIVSIWPPASLSGTHSSPNPGRFLSFDNPQQKMEIESPFFKGGIGYASNGMKVRYLTLSEMTHLFHGICSGLAHLHKQGIIHRDLKPPNLLLSYNNVTGSLGRTQYPSILISDFGECEVLSESTVEARERTGATGTMEFMPPELLLRDSQGNYLPNHSTSADMWSLGVILYYLCYSSVPYSQIEDVDALREEILAFRGMETFPDAGFRVPEPYKRLISRLMSPVPESRPRIEHVLAELREQDFFEETVQE